MIARELRDLVEISSPTILCLVETQLQKSRVEGLHFYLGYDFSFGVGSTGRSGGLCIFWKNSLDVAIKNFYEYHVDVWVTQTGKDQWRLISTKLRSSQTVMGLPALRQFHLSIRIGTGGTP